MASLASNKGLAATLVLGATLVLLLTSGALPALCEYLELVPLPPAAVGAADLSSALLSLMALDCVLCFAIEKGLARAFL